jgi:hypothetical protein
MTGIMKNETLHREAHTKKHQNNVSLSEKIENINLRKQEIIQTDK